MVEVLCEAWSLKNHRLSIALWTPTNDVGSESMDKFVLIFDVYVFSIHFEQGLIHIEFLFGMCLASLATCLVLLVSNARALMSSFQGDMIVC